MARLTAEEIRQFRGSLRDVIGHSERVIVGITANDDVSWQLIGGVPRPARVRHRSEMRSMTFGGRVALGSAATNFFVELLGEVTWPDGSDRDSSGRWSTGFELRLTEDLWVSTGLGRTFDSLTEPDRTVVLANVRWAVTSAARMDQLVRGARAVVSGS